MKKTTVSPYISTDRSGNLTGAGAEIRHSGAPNSGSAGFFTSGNTQVYYGNVERQISPSTSVSLGGSIDNSGNHNTQVGAKFTW